MPITEQIRSLARKEYAVLRTCITAVDRAVTPIAGERAGAVLTHTRDTLDRYAQLLLGRDQAAAGDAGTRRDRPSPAPAPTDVAQDAPAPAPEDGGDTADGADAADAAAPTSTDEGSAVLSEVEVDEVEELAEEYLEEEDGHLTGELAENDELRRVQAELRAKHTMQEIDESGSH